MVKNVPEFKIVFRENQFGLKVIATKNIVAFFINCNVVQQKEA